MTVSTQYQPFTFKPGAAMAAEAIPWQFLAGEQIVVTHIDAVTAVETVLVLGDNYSIGGSGPDGTGSVTAMAAWPVNDDWRIERLTSLEQEYELPPFEAIRSSALERENDRQLMALQEQVVAREALNARAYQLPAGEVAESLPSKIALAGKFLAHDALGNPVGSSGTGADAGLRNDMASLGGAALSRFDQEGAGAVPETTETALRRLVYAEQYGFGPLKTKEENLQGLKDAIAATATGGILRVGAKGALCVVDTSGGRSAAPVIDREMTIIFEGKTQASHGSVGVNPATLLHLVSPDVTLDIRGWLIGAGPVDATNSGDDSTMPSLIYGNGAHRLSIKGGGRIKDIPKIGIHLVNSDDWEIDNLRWRGGVPVAGRSNLDTGHHAIRATGGSGGTISRQRCIADPVTGAKYVNLFFGAGDAGAHINLEMFGNRVEVWQKLAYTYGGGHDIHHNRADNCLETDVIRLNGSHNRVTGNYGTAVKGVVTAYDGHSNTIADNEFDEVTQTGINVQRLEVGYVGGFNRTRILRNVVRANTAVAGRGSGIGVYIEGANAADDIDIWDNTSVGFADLTGGLILVQGVAPAAPLRTSVKRNKLSNGNRGVVFERCLQYDCDENVFDSITTYPIATNAGATGSFNRNRGKGGIGNIGIQGFNAASDTAEGNRWTDAILETTLTMATGTNTVSSAALPWIAPNARSYAYPTNGQARAQALVANGLVNCAIAGQVITINHDTGNNAVADQSYRIEIHQ